MYANQFAPNRGFRPASMTLALTMTVLPIAGLMLATHADKIIRFIDPPINVIDVKPIMDPPPDPPKTDPRKPIDETIRVPPVTTPTLPSENPIKTTADPFPPLPPVPEVGTGTGTVIEPVKPPKAVIVGPSYDQRYANALQPPYPASEIRSGNTGRVVIRVLVGTDGRVKQVERISAASDAFFAAAERQALTKWRFKPATSDGTPIEQWMRMALRFELQDR